MLLKSNNSSSISDSSSLDKSHFFLLSTVPAAPGGTKFCRNPTPPAEVIHYKFTLIYCVFSL